MRHEINHHKCRALRNFQQEEMTKLAKKKLLASKRVLVSSRFTRPDISAAASILSRFASNPLQEHQRLADRVIPYLNKTSKKWLLLGGSEIKNLVACTDDDYASDFS